MPLQMVRHLPSTPAAMMRMMAMRNMRIGGGAVSGP
jgi:hypothetical protein